MEYEFEQFSCFLNGELKDEVDSIILFAILSNLRISCHEHSNFLKSTIYIVIPFYNTRQFLKIVFRNFDNKVIEIIHQVETTIVVPQFKIINKIKKDASIKNIQKSLEVIKSFKSSMLEDLNHLNNMGI